LGEAEPAELRHGPFPRFWLSRVLSTLSFQMLAVAVGWQLYALTNDPFDLGLVGLVQFLPVLLLTLPAGHWADRGDRRAIVAGCQALVAVLAALLLLGSLQGWLGRGAIFALIGAIGCARAVEAPNMASLLPGLVPRAIFPRAAAWSASATQTAQILGPALGGLLYALGPGARPMARLRGCCWWGPRRQFPSGRRSSSTGRSGRGWPGCSPASASSGGMSWCWAPFRSICSPPCWAGRWR
jgi:MFS family permease